jgi:hypothetical protein
MKRRKIKAFIKELMSTCDRNNAILDRELHIQEVRANTQIEKQVKLASYEKELRRENIKP